MLKAVKKMHAFLWGCNTCVQVKLETSIRFSDTQFHIFDENYNTGNIYSFQATDRGEAVIAIRIQRDPESHSQRSWIDDLRINRIRRLGCMNFGITPNLGERDQGFKCFPNISRKAVIIRSARQTESIFAVIYVLQRIWSGNGKLLSEKIMSDRFAAN